MTTVIVWLLSLLTLSAVGCLNGGFSSSTGHTASSEGAQSTVKGKWVGSTGFATNLPSWSSKYGVAFSAACAREEIPSIRQKRCQPSPVWRGHGRGDGLEHACENSQGSLCLTSTLRGGEAEPGHDTVQQWHSAPSRHPRSLPGVVPGVDVLGSDAGARVKPGADYHEEDKNQITVNETVTTFVSECVLPTSRGKFRLRAYKHEGNGRSFEPVVMVSGEISGMEGVPLRVHDQCMTSEVLGSMRCDCKEQLDLALEHISVNGGCVIYMQQEGRGIGLANKVAAYALQDGGLDTVDANRHLGFEDDLRSYEAVEYILADMGVKSVKLMTNNPFKLKCLKAMGIKVLSRIPLLVSPNVHSLAYLKAKAQRMNHLLHQFDDTEIMSEIAVDGTVPPVALPLDEVGAIRGGRNNGETSQENEDYAFGRNSVLAAIEAVRAGKCVVVTDDEGRENEGDIIFAAEKATEDLVAFTIRHTSGVICAALGEDRLEELQLPQMVPNNEDPKLTAFAVTVDAKEGITTGISAGDRAITLRALAHPKGTAGDFCRPGHIFPLRYTAGGVLCRGGHTEASVDLARLAGLEPVGVLCEVTTEDGKRMARLPELREFCADHGLVLTSIQDLRCLMRERQRMNIHDGADPLLPCLPHGVR